MNEKIKELAEQAGLEPTSGSWLFTPGIDPAISKAVANAGYSVELQKFAELIVKDIIDTALFKARWYQAENDVNAVTALCKLIGDIREDFGVE